MRQRLVLAEATLLAVLAVTTVLSATLGDGWSTGFFVVWMVGMLGFIPLHSLLNVGIRGLFDRSGRSLDEHQWNLRARSLSAVNWPRGALTLMALVCGIAVVAATDHVALALSLGFLLWFAAGLSASWHLAWTMAAEVND